MHSKASRCLRTCRLATNPEGPHASLDRLERCVEDRVRGRHALLGGTRCSGQSDQVRVRPSLNLMQLVDRGLQWSALTLLETGLRIHQPKLRRLRP